LAACYRPEVVLLDIGLPEMDGYEVAKRIRHQPGGEDIMLVAVTGWGQADDRRRASDAGFDIHLTKPVEHAVLMKLLERLTPASRPTKPK
jgi:CheY-like chemotaxis protein